MTHRVRLVAADQYIHLAVECRREQEDLAVAGSLVENASHRREESHVRHAICLIDDGDGHILKTYVAPVDEVLETAWAGHQDVDGLTQGPQLRSVARAAIDGGDGEASGLREGTEHTTDLSGQLAGRHEHETSRTASLGTRTAGEGLDDRDRERERLARARRRPAAHVPTGERVRESLLPGSGTGLLFRHAQAALTTSAGTPRSAKVGDTETPVSSKKRANQNIVSRPHRPQPETGQLTGPKQCSSRAPLPARDRERRWSATACARRPDTATGCSSNRTSRSP